MTRLFKVLEIARGRNGKAHEGCYTRKLPAHGEEVEGESRTLQRVRGKAAKMEKSEIRNVSVWLDDVLWDYDGFPRLKEGRDGQKTLFIRVSVKRGRITIPLKPHKLFLKKVAYAIFTFHKEIEYEEEKELEMCIAVDYRVRIVKTNVDLITKNTQTL